MFHAAIFGHDRLGLGFEDLVQELERSARAQTLSDRGRVAQTSEGLAPLIVAEVGRTIAKLKAQGQSIVLVEQNVKMALELADDAVLLNTGRVAFSGPAAQVRDNPTLITQHLGVF